MFSIETILAVVAVGAFVDSVATFAVSRSLAKANKRIGKLESLALDTYKGHHEHILLANRDKNCCEEVSSKTEPSLIRDPRGNRGSNAAFTTEAKISEGFCTRTKAKKTTST